MRTIYALAFCGVALLIVTGFIGVLLDKSEDNPLKVAKADKLRKGRKPCYRPTQAQPELRDRPACRPRQVEDDRGH